MQLEKIYKIPSIGYATVRIQAEKGGPAKTHSLQSLENVASSNQSGGIWVIFRCEIGSLTKVIQRFGLAAYLFGWYLYFNQVASRQKIARVSLFSVCLLIGL